MYVEDSGPTPNDKTVESENNKATETNNTPAIVGGAVAGIVILVIAVIVIFVYKSRGNSNREQPATHAPAAHAPAVSSHTYANTPVNYQTHAVEKQPYEKVELAFAPPPYQTHGGAPNNNIYQSSRNPAALQNPIDWKK